MKKVIICIAIAIICLASCFGSSSPFKSEEEKEYNANVVDYIIDRAKRDTILTYKNIPLGIKHKDALSERTVDTIIDNNMNAHILDVYYEYRSNDYRDYSQKYDSLERISMNDFSVDYSADKFKAIRDLYISKYGPFSLYRKGLSYNEYSDFYAPSIGLYYEDILKESNDDLAQYESSSSIRQLSYIWCWANCYILIKLEKESGLEIEYKLDAQSIFLDFVLPEEEPEPISNKEKENIKNKQSI